MTRPLRSLLIGDIDHYPSEFIFGVNQGMTLLGHWHSTINIRQPIEIIRQRVRQMRPDVIWGHMLLWAPGDSGPDASTMKKTFDLLALCASARTLRGTRVVIHDGDARSETRFPFEIAGAVDLALCNHTASREEWGIPYVRWPYFAFVQPQIVAPVDEFRCDLAFAGRLAAGIYAQRTEMVNVLSRILGARFKLFTGNPDDHTLFRTAELAASAVAVLGYGRPDAPGWVDVRVFQYPGAGGVLLHDDVGGYLEPGKHYLPYETGNVESIIEALDFARVLGPRIRDRAFAHVQQYHSSVSRVREALTWLDLA